MKKYFERLRQWLIKKLGGYTKDVKVHKVQAQLSIQMPLGELESAADFERYFKARAADILAQKLYDSGFIQWQRQDDPCRVNILATLCVADANEMVPWVESWVE